MSATDRARAGLGGGPGAGAGGPGPGPGADRPSHRSTTSAALGGIDKTHGKNRSSSWANRLSLDWTRRDGSRSGSKSFLPLGLFSSYAAGPTDRGGGNNNKYEPVAPMEARKRQKSVFELDMGDFSEGLRLSTARDGDEQDRYDAEADDLQRRRMYQQAQQRAEGRQKRKRRKSSGAIGAFVSWGVGPRERARGKLADGSGCPPSGPSDCSLTNSTRPRSKRVGGRSNGPPSSSPSS